MMQFLSLLLFLLPVPLRAQCELTQLSSASEDDGVHFGRVLGLSSGVMAVSERVNDVNVLEVYERDAQGAFSLSSRFKAGFLYSIDVDGDRVVAGRPIWAISAPDGTASVYERGPNGWVEFPLVVPEGNVAVSYGADVEIDGDIAVVSNTDLIGLVAPTLFVFRRSEHRWRLTDRISSPGNNYAQAAFFGAAISLQGTTLLVGSVSSRNAYLYELEPEGARLVASIDSGGVDNFGTAVSLGEDFAAIGAAPYGGVEEVGSVHVYRRVGTGANQGLELLDVLAPSAPGGATNEFGGIVSVSGSQLLATFGGQAELYSLSEAGADLTNYLTLGNEIDLFSADLADGSFALGQPLGGLDGPGVVLLHDATQATCTAAIPKLLSATPAQVPSVAAGDGLNVTVYGAGLQDVASVWVDGAELINVPGQPNWKESSGTSIALRMPLVDSLGAVELRVEAPLGTATLDLNVVPAEPPALELNGGVEPSILTSFLPATVTVGGTPGYLAVTLWSTSPEPTSIPGLLELGLGSGGDELFVLRSDVIGGAGWLNFDEALAGLPTSSFLFFQVVTVDPDGGALAVSNLWSSTFWF